MKNHVVNLNLAKKLKEAGFPQESEFWWFDGALEVDTVKHGLVEIDPTFYQGEDDEEGHYAAPLATELLEQVNKAMVRTDAELKIGEGYRVTGDDYTMKFDDVAFKSKSLPDALAEMYLWLKENGHL